MITIETTIELTESKNLSIISMKRVEEQTTPQMKAIFEPMLQTGNLPGIEHPLDGNNLVSRDKNFAKQNSRLLPKLRSENTASELRKLNGQTANHENNNSSSKP